MLIHTYRAPNDCMSVVKRTTTNCVKHVRNMSLDPQPAMDEQNRPLSLSLAQHTVRFNGLKMVMASEADYYLAGKSGDAALIASIRDDLKVWVVTDRYDYAPDSLEAKITRYAGSEVVTPVERTVVVPVYAGDLLEIILNRPEGLAYMQARLNTSDDAETIKTTLFNLTGKTGAETKVWTPDLASRKQVPSRAAFLDDGGDAFRVYGYYGLYSSGCSRGVRREDGPAGAAARKSVFEAVLPPDLVPEIDAAAGCVHLARTQRTGQHSRFSGLYCFAGERFLFTMTSGSTIDATTARTVAHTLAGEELTSVKLGALEETLRPLYAHLQRFARGENGYALVDDAEAFGNPRVRA